MDFWVHSQITCIRDQPILVFPLIMAILIIPDPDSQSALAWVPVVWFQPLCLYKLLSYHQI